MDSESLKCVVIGDGAVGKTCLLIRYAKDEYPTAYIPTVFDSYAVSLPIGDETYELHLFDTAGQEDYDQLRRLAFTNTDVLLVCFAVDYWPSFINVREMWVPELRKYCPGVPFLLVGTKIDMRHDQKTIEKLATEGKSPISQQQGKRLAQELKAVKYVECSALTKENISNVFQEAIVAALSDNSSRTPSPTVNIRNTGATHTASYHTSGGSINNPAVQKDEDDKCCLMCPKVCSNFCNCTIM